LFNNSAAKSVGIISLGCVKNRVDTEEMLGNLAAAGWQVTAKPEDATVLIVNTCGFINPAKQESIDTILELAQYKETGKCRVLCVTGCLSQRYGDTLFQEMPEIDVLVGINQYDRLPSILEQALEGDRVFNTRRREQEACPKRVLTTPPFSAYVRIGEGCDNRCAYCAIPLIRGGHISRLKDDVLFEMRGLAQQGVKEQILIAQDTTRFGTERGESLVQLMDEAAQIPSLEWLRVLYLYPDETDLALIDTMAKHQNICRYLDLPLQHASERMLKKMNRRGKIADIKRLLHYARERGFALRTTFIVGFPGETEEDFQELLDFTKEMAFDRMGAFAYSKEEDTPAANMPGQIPEKVKQQRLDALMRLQQTISLENNQKRVGSVEKALVVGKRDDKYLCRTAFEAPDADGEILVTADKPLNLSDFIQIRITKADIYDLEAQEIKGESL
jgi:ribosomal protein S12 methylthiotransferase